jgi:hypothetical protein
VKLYIEIETTSDKLCLIAFDEVLRQIRSIIATSGFHYINKEDERLVYCIGCVTDQMGGVVTASLVNQTAKCACGDPERDYWNI